jgi:hypothetical protein
MHATLSPFHPARSAAALVATACSPPTRADWTQYLTADLLDFNGTAAQKALVMGGGEFAHVPRARGDVTHATAAELLGRQWCSVRPHPPPDDAPPPPPIAITT